MFSSSAIVQASTLARILVKTWSVRAADEAMTVELIKVTGIPFSCMKASQQGKVVDGGRALAWMTQVRRRGRPLGSKKKPLEQQREN
jgi:hypothetical protein